MVDNVAWRWPRFALPVHNKLVQKVVLLGSIELGLAAVQPVNVAVSSEVFLRYHVVASRSALLKQPAMFDAGL